MFRFEIEEYQMRDIRALWRAMGRRAPFRRAAFWALRLALGALGLLFGLTVAFFWGTFLASGPAAALRPGSNGLAVAVVCHAACLLCLAPALGWGQARLRRLLRAQGRLTPLAVTLGGEEIGIELPRWPDSLPCHSVEAVYRVRECWVLFLRGRRVLVLPERCLVRGGAYSLEAFFEGRAGKVQCLGGMGNGI